VRRSTRGAQVAALDRARPPADATLAAGAFALGELDLAEADAAVRALDQVTSRFGGLDALVNVAGTFRWETLEKGSLDAWDLLYRVNLRSAVSTSRAALPHLFRRGGGRIVQHRSRCRRGQGWRWHGALIPPRRPGWPSSPKRWPMN